MFVCPLCNQIEQQQYICPNCQKEMEDEGRVMDYFDDYSAYLDIEGMKLFNGYPTDQKNHECPHVFSCFNCSKEVVHLIKEVKF
jgi:DNA-directed RNA polymerase subunit RPC12/RpoP